MSGGSYNYLASKEANDLYPSHADLQSMRERLHGIGYARAALAKTDALIEQLREVDRQRKIADDLIDELSDVWHSVEWTDSGDWCENDLREVLIRFEAKHLGDS